MSVSKRVFGSDVDLKTKNKIRIYQGQAAGQSNEDILAGVNKQIKNANTITAAQTELKSLGDLNSNFKGASSLSARTPFIRMWTAISSKIRMKNAAFSDMTYEEWASMDDESGSKTWRVSTGLNYWAAEKKAGRYYAEKEDWWQYYISKVLFEKVYALGTNDLQMLSRKPMTAINMSSDGSSDNNQHFAIQPGITSLSSDSQGPLGLTRKTTVNFVIHNPHDYDNIYSKYFLRTGALMFVDFGWDTATNGESGTLYDPSSFIQQSKEKGFDMEDLLYGDNGYVENADREMETIVGYVTNFSSALNENGLYECSVTISSKNSALIGGEYPNTEAKEKLFMGIDAEIVNMAAAYFETEQARLGQEDKKHQFLDASKNYATQDVEDWNKYARLFAAQQLSSNVKGSRINTPIEAKKTGVYFWGNTTTARDDKLEPSDDSSKMFIMIGLLEDVILNSNLAIGDTADITHAKTKNFVTRYNSSNSFTRLDPTLEKAMKFGAHAETPKFLYCLAGHDETFNTVRNKVPDDRLDSKGQYLTTTEGSAYEKLYVNPTTNKEVEGSYIRWSKIDQDLNRIPIRECFVSLQVVKDAFLGNDSIELAMKQILDTINHDTDGILNLTLHTTNKSESEIAIIDRNKLEMTDPSNLQGAQNYFDNMLTFSPGSETSIVQSFGLNMDTPKKGMQSMIAIQSSSPDRGMFPYSSDIASQLNLYLLNYDTDQAQIGFSYLPQIGDDTISRVEDANDGMIKMGTISANNSIYEHDDPLVRQKLQRWGGKKWYNTQKEGSSKEDARIKALNRANNQEDDDADEEDQTVTSSKDLDYESSGYKVVTSLAEFYKFLARNNYFGNENLSPIVQLKLKLSIYGLQGLQTGDVFKIDYLPSRYKKICYFQITKVNHKVSPSGWSTDLESVMRIRHDAKLLYKNAENNAGAGAANMQKINDVVANKIILSKSIFNNLGLRMDTYTMKYSTCTPQEFADSIAYLQFVKTGGLRSDGYGASHYVFKFKANTTNPYLLAKQAAVPVSEDDWSYYEVFKGVFNMGYSKEDRNSWSWYQKGFNDFTFALNGDTSSQSFVTYQKNLKKMLGVPNHIYSQWRPQWDRWNQQGKKQWEKDNHGGFSGKGPHFYMFPKFEGDFSWGTGITADFFICNTGVVIWPEQYYYLLVWKHNYMVIPVEMPQLLIDRVDTVWRWYDGSGEPHKI